MTLTRWKNILLGHLLAALYKILGATWDYRMRFCEGLEPIAFPTKRPSHPLIVGHWHGDELALIRWAGYSKWLTMASQSSDGTIMATFLRSLGFRVIRGSSSRGGAKALLALIRELKKENYYSSFALDGPRGPLHKAKPGIYILSRKLDIQVIQVLVECDSKWSFPKTWNKTYLPKPFARITLSFFPLPHPKQTSQENFLKALDARIQPPAAPFTEVRFVKR